MAEDSEWRRGSPAHAIAAVKKLGGTLRQRQLHSVACYRLVEKFITNPDCRKLIDLVEAFADDPSLAPEVARLRRKIGTWAKVTPGTGQGMKDWVAKWSAWAAADPKAVAPVTGFVKSPEFRDLLGEVYGPREGVPAFSPEWRTETVAALATGIYAERAFDRTPILADALMDAGCGDEQILSHCRNEGPHVRGCWVIDACLG